MNFRARLFLAFAGVVVLPLAALLVGIRVEVGRRLSAQYGERVNALASVIRHDLEERGRTLGERLSALATEIGSDNRFRLALHASRDRRYLLDHAGQAMRRVGLAMLMVQDSTGRILTSGHFRNEYDRVAPRLAPLLGENPKGTALVRVRLPEGPLLVLARADSVELAGERLTVVGGLAVTPGLASQLSGDPELSIALRLPDDTSVTAADDAAVTAEFHYPFVDVTTDVPAQATARVVISQSLAPLHALRRSVDRRFLAAGLLTLALALAVAGWISSRISRPLRELAEQTSRLDLDRLNAEFASAGDDEIGSLSRLLGAMTHRLRIGAARLREAERRATVGDLARQLNHDVKNGLIPIRNVLRHLAQVARDEPARLPAVLLERQETLDAGITYLENLARNYARLSPALDRQPCDLNAVISDIVHGLSDSHADIRLELSQGLPRVAADPLVIRRIVENLVSNAVESLASPAGVVTVSTANGGGSASATVRLTVTDAGRGMSERELERALEDFYTTKPGGTGLGLSVVKRLVLDLNGSMRVETAPGSGTRFMIDLPVAT
ncbi:MAG: HAMP domain-containing histidine kinase [Gemmatimonadetes bacterium]|nr:HAMP domain-containing histidine kinase [Gemmatimonadota bacterium]